MKKSKRKKLSLSKNTLRRLSADKMARVAAGSAAGDCQPYSETVQPTEESRCACTWIFC